MSINVLVTSAGSAIGCGIIKSLKQSYIKTRIIGVNSHMYGAGLYRSDSCYVVPLAKDESYIDTIIDICKQESVDLVMVGLDYELRILSQNKERIESETKAKVIVSDERTINIADDKWETYKFLRDNGFPYINTCKEADLDEFLGIAKFPLIVKPNIGDSSIGCTITENETELGIALSLGVQQRSDTWNSGRTHFIIQEYLGTNDDEFTTTTVCFDGVCHGVITMNREMRFGGHTTKAVIQEYPEINAQIEEIVTRLNPNGPCNFQSRVINGIPYIFEINSRFSGTTATCAMVGFNHVQTCVEHALNLPLSELGVQDGVMLRYFNEVFVPKEEMDGIKNEGYRKYPRSKVNWF